MSDFVGGLKANASKLGNDTSGLIKKFGWQEGFGALSVSVSQKDQVARYIRTQAEHHAQEAIQDEYIRLLDRHEFEYDLRYVWN